MDVDLKSVLRAAAPMLGTAIGGPFGAVAGKLVAEALGQPDAPPQDLPAAVAAATPEQMAALRQAEQQFTLRMRELGFDNQQKLAALEVEDRKSARDMQMATRSQVPPMLAFMVVLAWAAVQAYLFTHIIDPSMRELIARVLGTLDGALMLVLSFYFGSSHGSQQKTELMAAKE